MMRTLFEARAIDEPDDKPEDEAEDRPEDSDEGAVGARRLGARVGRSPRSTQTFRSNGFGVGRHSEATDRNEGDEQHPEYQGDQRDRLGVDRIRLRDRSGVCI